MNNSEIIVHSLKEDGRVHREWDARLVERVDSLIVVEGVFADEIRHPQLGIIAPNTRSREYYWTDRWYSIFRFQEPDGRLRNYYCNVNRPVVFDGHLLTFVDLDIDVLVAPDLSFRVLDEDEFETHAALYNYSTALRKAVERARAELIALIEARHFPFEGPV